MHPLHILWSILVGFAVGLVARAIMPGAQNLGFLATAGVGIVGSLLGGFAGRLISKPAPDAPVHPAGIIMSIVGALVVLFLWQRLAV
jgi:uncharacterized membrane protein YeaQ/YmgE (transglycosylase-associated protein family)